LISVRPTFHDAVAESVRQVAGTILGALLGYGIVLFFGFNPITMFVLMLLVFAVARVLRLGNDGASVIGVTMILVMGPLAKLDLIESRWVSIVLGALVAAVASFWVRPGLPYTRALEAAQRIEEQLAAILRDMAEHISEHKGAIKQETVREVLTRTSESLRELERVRIDAEAAVKAARWSPMLDQDTARDVLAQVKTVQSTAETVQNMARTLDTAVRSSEGDALPKSVAQRLARVIHATADIVEDATPTATFQALEDEHGAAVESIKKLDDTAPILVGTGLLQDTRNLARKKQQSRQRRK
jgi:uncharacterized membrane protein YgaE (UPF0421/DUF939 family)